MKHVAFTRHAKQLSQRITVKEFQEGGADGEGDEPGGHKSTNRLSDGRSHESAWGHMSHILVSYITFDLLQKLSAQE